MMADPRSGLSGPVAWIVVASLVGVTALVTVLLWWLGDWENHGWALTLTLRIVWGSCLVGCLAAILTRVTIFGWYFRRYFHWGEEKEPSPEAPRSPPPWPKSPAASFSITVVLVSLTGTAVIASAVLWILRDALGDWWLWTLLKIIWAVWWVAVIAVVLTRVSIFGVQKRRATEKQDEPPGISHSEHSAEDAPARTPPDAPPST
jgi:NADH:ubiquinone oxidoreductase subunit 5 (subunit L)/multisubunit Na+/H+ antiporter MnhA subunit